MANDKNNTKLYIQKAISLAFVAISDFSLSGNNFFETSDIADSRFPFGSSERVPPSLTVFLQKNIIAKLD